MRSSIVACALVTSALLVLFSSPVEAQQAQVGARQFVQRDASEVVPASYGSAHALRSEQFERRWEEPSTLAPGEFSASNGDADWTSDDSCCSDDCCDACADCCGEYCGPCGLSAGVEATYLRPTYDDNGSAFVLSPEYDYEAAPRVWVQWQGSSGWGVRARYWDFDADQGRSGVIDQGDTLGAQAIVEDLEVLAIDLELTRAFAVAETDCWASLGARHGSLKHYLTQQLTIFDLAGGGGDDATVIFQEGDTGFRGTGVTAALDMRRPIFQSQLAAVCNLRGSYLWGKNEIDFEGAVIEVVPVGAGDLDLNDFQQLQVFGRDNDGMWIGELQAGAEWSTPISDAYGGGNVSIRAVFEAQWWNLPGVSNTNLGISTSSLLHEFLGVTAAVAITR